MEIIETGIRDLKIIKPKVFEDARGYFFESYNEKRFNEMGLMQRFVQDNQSKSSYGVIRGLHYQLNPKAQSKLIRVLKGTIWDVAVDLREGSPTFLQWRGVELSAESQIQFLVPKGFAHGFSVLSETAVVFYKCDELYTPDFEAGIRFDDQDIGVDWKVEAGSQVISERDLKMPGAVDATMNFRYE